MQRVFSSMEEWIRMGSYRPSVPVPIHFSAVLSLRGPLTLESIRNALERAQKAHFLSRVRVITRPGALSVFTDEKVGPVPILTVDRTRDDTWTSHAASLFEDGFDYAEGPLIRVIWVRGADVSDLIFYFDHMAADGLAALYLLEDFLKCLADPALELPEGTPPPRLDEIYPPQAEKEIEEKIAAEMLKNKGFWNGFKNWFKKWTTPGITFPKPLRHSVMAARLSPEQTSAFTALCRDKGTSVHAALSVFFLRRFAMLDHGPFGKSRTVLSPVNLRPFLDLGRAYGTYVSHITNTAELPDGCDIWRAASLLKDSMKEKASINSLLTGMGFARYYMKKYLEKPWPSPKKWKRDTRKEYDLSFTNLGRVDIASEYGPYKIEAVYAPVAMGLPTEQVLGAVTAAGILTLTFIYKEFNIKPETAREIFRGAVEDIINTVS